MIEVRLMEGRACPMVICDRCGEQITERGVVGYREFGDPKPAFLHKRRCDDRDEYPYWDELSHWLIWLVENTRINSEGNREAARLMTEL